MGLFVRGGVDCGWFVYEGFFEKAGVYCLFMGRYSFFRSIDFVLGG